MTGYMKLYTAIREKITGGVYRAGERLPSKRQLADESGYSVITVEHAYDLLTEEGYVEPRERSGYYVIYKEYEAYPVGDSRKAAARSEPETVPVESREEGEREMFPFSAFARTMRNVLSSYGKRILDPSPHQGCRELREALSSYLARSRNMIVSPDDILIGSGAEYLYGLNVQVLGRDRIYALEKPSYEKIQKVYEASQVQVELLKMGKEGIETEELERSRASVLHVTPFNSYPSGITASASKRAEYIRWAKERHGYIIEDDFDSEFTLLSKPEDTLFSLAPDGPVIYMNSFSKTIAPSIRVGYLVLPDILLPSYEEKIGFYSCTVPVFDQLVLAEFIASGQFERHINRVRRKRRKIENAGKHLQS
ncbi:PLP-dependent aminotransferase family protein [Dialister sp.]|uniref:MocR-like pyridoxine biosynthesis transcription factor PdxR n=1 Tax=Dialister sp. TaxID=1955814 RepID=UPI003F0AC6FD